MCGRGDFRVWGLEVSGGGRKVGGHRGGAVSIRMRVLRERENTLARALYAHDIHDIPSGVFF